MFGLVLLAFVSSLIMEITTYTAGPREYVQTDKAEYTLGDTIIVDGWVDTSPIVYGVGGQSVDVRTVKVSLERLYDIEGLMVPGRVLDEIREEHCYESATYPSPCRVVGGEIYAEFEVTDDLVRSEDYRIVVTVTHWPYPGEYAGGGGLPDTVSVIKSSYFALK